MVKEGEMTALEILKELFIDGHDYNSNIGENPDINVREALASLRKDLIERVKKTAYKELQLVCNLDDVVKEIEDYFV